MRALIIVLITIISPWARAGQLTIFDVRKPIALADNEKTQKDYYIDAGTEAGLQVGMVITVVRKVSLYDTYQNHSAGELSVPVAKIKIIHVQGGLSVARFHSEIARNETPILEENFIMAGDHLDLATATRDKKSASNDGEPAPVAAPAAAPAAAPTGPVTSPQQPSAAVTPPPPQPTAALVTSEKIEALNKANKDDDTPNIAPAEGPTVQ